MTWPASCFGLIFTSRHFECHKRAGLARPVGLRCFLLVVFLMLTFSDLLSTSHRWADVEHEHKQQQHRQPESRGHGGALRHHCPGTGAPPSIVRVLVGTNCCRQRKNVDGHARVLASPATELELCLVSVHHGAARDLVLRAHLLLYVHRCLRGKQLELSE